MNFHKFLYIAFFTLFSFSALAKVVPEKEAVAWIDKTGRDFIQALGTQNLEQKHLLIDQMFNQDVDTSYIARFVLGKYWKKLTKQQQSDYVSMFKRYVLSLYKTYPLNFNSEKIKFSIISTSVSGNFTNVTCLVDVSLDNMTEIQNISLVFKLSQTQKGIQIVDITIEESSLLIAYRKKFQEMILKSEEDMVWFLEDFETLTISTEKNALSNLSVE